MAIVKMNKFTLLSFESHKEKLLKLLQDFRGVEFINLQDDVVVEKNEAFKGLHKDRVSDKYHENEENLSKIKFSLEMINKYSPSKKGSKDMFGNKKEVSFEKLESAQKETPWLEVYVDLKDKERKLSELQNEQSKLETEIEVMNKWKGLEASFQDLRNLKFSKAFIGTISRQYEENLHQELSNNLKYSWFKVIGSDNADIYIVLIVHNSEENNALETLKTLGFSAFTTNYTDEPKNLINEFENRTKNSSKEISSIKEEIEKLSLKREGLELSYEYYKNLILRDSASNNFLKSNRVTAISGWITKEEKDSLTKLLQNNFKNEAYIEYSEPEGEEEVPIKLQNNKFVSSFEGVLEMYSLPKYREIDPTPLFSVFYFIFFGMMLSDAGYGVLMVLGSAFMMYKTKDEEKKKTYRLFFFAGISTIIWGAIYGGWFGDLLPKYFGVKIPFLLDPAANVLTLMVISVIFGVIHIFLGLGIKAYMLIRDGHLKDAIYDVFTWYATLIGVLLWAVGLGLGKWVFVIGIIGLLLTQGRSAPTFVGKIGGGVYGVYGITAYFGDVVSYLRLLALGLTTGFIANAMNLILSLLAGNIVMRIVLVPILFVLFHVFNLALNAVGTYVHTARLQYLEFFNKFYEGGGKRFKPFEYCDEYIKVQKEN